MIFYNLKELFMILISFRPWYKMWWTWDCMLATIHHYANIGELVVFSCVWHVKPHTTPTNIQMNTFRYLDWKLCSSLIEGYLVQRVNKRKIKVKSPVMNSSLDLLTLWLTGLYNSSSQVSTWSSQTVDGTGELKKKDEIAPASR